MNSTKFLSTILFAILLFTNVKTIAQDGNYYAKRAFVLQYVANENLLRVDADVNNVFGQYETKIEVTPSSVLMNKKKKELDISSEKLLFW